MLNLISNKTMQIKTTKEKTAGARVTGQDLSVPTPRSCCRCELETHTRCRRKRTAPVLGQPVCDAVPSLAGFAAATPKDSAQKCSGNTAKKG